MRVTKLKSTEDYKDKTVHICRTHLRYFYFGRKNVQLHYIIMLVY